MQLEEPIYELGFRDSRFILLVQMEEMILGAMTTPVEVQNNLDEWRLSLYFP